MSHRSPPAPLRRNLLAVALAAAFSVPAAVPSLTALAVPALTTLALSAVLAPTSDHAAIVTTLAGGGSAGGTASGHADGSGTTATFAGPHGVAVDGSGNLYVADWRNSLIRKIDASGNVTTWAGGGVSGTATGHADGSGTAATFDHPYGIATDGSGNVYVSDTGNSLIRKIDTSGNVTTLASVSSCGDAAVDGSGNVYVADSDHNRIRKIDANGTVTTLAGGGTRNHTNGNGTAATFFLPCGVALDGNGNLYVADQFNYLIRKIVIATGEVTTLAGGGATGIAPGHADGNGTAATFNKTTGVAVDGSGNVYVADGGVLIRKIDANGNVTTLAGGGSVGGAASGYADGGTVAKFYGAYSVAVDSSGNVYVADLSNSLIRKITPGPGLSSSVPAAYATDVAPGATIALTFSEAISIGSGNFTIVNDTDHTSEIIDVAAPPASLL